MTDTADRIAMRAQILAAECKQPRTATPDEIASALHEVGCGLVDLGGVQVLDNAIAVLTQVVDGWPGDMRPTPGDIARQAAWCIRQEPTSAGPTSPTASVLADRIEDAIAGRLVAAPWPWATLGANTQALLPGAITLLVGSPGASKSFLLLQSTLWWLSEDWKVSIYALEEDPAFWLNRALALLSGVGATTDPAWLAANAGMARGLLAASRPDLDRLAGALTCAPPQGIDLRGLAEWIGGEAKAGKRIICADPLTAASVGAGKPWLAAEDFMLRTKRAAVEHGASIVLTTHGRKGDKSKGPPDLDSMAGGAAYARFASTVLWLEATDPESVSCIDADGRDQHAACNRRLRVLKARNGRGTGQTIGMWFEGQSLSIHERGIIVPARPAQPADARHQAARLKQKPQPSEHLFGDDP